MHQPEHTFKHNDKYTTNILSKSYPFSHFTVHICITITLIIILIVVIYDDVVRLLLQEIVMAQ